MTAPTTLATMTGAQRRALFAGWSDHKLLRRAAPQTRTVLLRAGLIESFRLPGLGLGGAAVYGYRLTAAGIRRAVAEAGDREPVIVQAEAVAALLAASVARPGPKRLR